MFKRGKNRKMAMEGKKKKKKKKHDDDDGCLQSSSSSSPSSSSRSQSWKDSESNLWILDAVFEIRGLRQRETHEGKKDACECECECECGGQSEAVRAGEVLCLARVQARNFADVLL